MIINNIRIPSGCRVKIVGKRELLEEIVICLSEHFELVEASRCLPNLEDPGFHQFVTVVREVQTQHAL